MKKIVSAILAVALVSAFGLTGCKDTAPTPEQTSQATEAPAAMKAIAKEDLKVGFVYIGTKDDGGYSQAHEKGRQMLIKELGLKEDQTLIAENVKENVDECSSTIENLIAQGCNVIYANSFGFGDAVLKVAKNYPDIYFGHATGLETAPNVCTYFGRMYEGRYLAGIAAGLNTKTNKIGYVAAYAIPEVIRGLNAFTLGAKSVNPDATVEVKWLNSWFDPAKEKSTAVDLLNGGCDVIAQHCDTTGPQTAAQEKGAKAVGYNSPTHDSAPKAYITAPLFNWGAFYVEDVKNIIAGTWKSQAFWKGMDADLIHMDELYNCTDETKTKMDDAKAKILDGSLFVFSGELKDNEGNVVVEAGKNMTDDEMLGMSWLVEGVKGSIPKAEE